MFNLEKEYINKNMMGPNSITIIKELTQNSQLKQGMKVLDLGCGMGLTSIYLAQQFNVEVFAVDLWISATDNYNRFKELNLENSIIPLNCNANELPFANEYFDAVISVDSYHYFGNNNTFFDEKIKPLIKPNGQVLIAFPSMKQDYTKNIPQEMQPFWEEEALQMWQSTNWWKDNFSKELKNMKIQEMQCYNQSWQDWLQTDNEYAITDRDMFNTDNGRYMNLISIIGNL